MNKRRQNDEKSKTFYFYTDLESTFNCKRVRAILNGKLLLTNPSLFNDPFDSKLRIRHEYTKESAMQYLGWNKRDSALPRIFWRNQDPIKAAEAKKEKNLWQRWWTFCVSEVCDSILMWSHYGKSHKGICLELECNDTYNHTDFFFSKVRYTTHYPEIKGGLIDDGDKDALKTLLLTKSIDWYYEKEWRFVAHNVPEQFDGHINSPFKVTGIIFGNDFVRGDSFDFINETIRDQFEDELSGRPDISDDEHNELVSLYSQKLTTSLREIENGNFEYLITESERDKKERLFCREQVIQELILQKIPVYKYSIATGEFSLSLDKYKLLPCSSLLSCFWGMDLIKD